MFQINVLCFRYMYYVSDICIVFALMGHRRDEQRGKTSDWSIFAGKPPMINQ